MISPIPLKINLLSIYPFSFVQFEVAIQTELQLVLKHKFLEYQVQYLKFAKKLLQFQWLFEMFCFSEPFYIKQCGALKVFLLLSSRFFLDHFPKLIFSYASSSTPHPRQ